MLLLFPAIESSLVLQRDDATLDDLFNYRCRQFTRLD